MYQPRISDENIQRLYLLKVQRKRPMTHVLDEILNDYFEAQKKEVNVIRRTQAKYNKQGK